VWIPTRAHEQRRLSKVKPIETREEKTHNNQPTKAQDNPTEHCFAYLIDKEELSLLGIVSSNLVSITITSGDPKRSLPL